MPRADGAGAPRWRLADTAAVAALCLISFAWWRGAMLGFFFFDDFWVMRDAVHVPPGDVTAFFRFGHAGYELYRPLSTVMYFYALRALFGFDSSGYHAVQLLVFTLNGVLAFAIVRRLSGSTIAALAAGVIYLLAPGQAVGVYWLAAFTVTGTVCIMLLAVWCWLALAAPWRMWAVAALQLAGLLASEHAITLPVLLAIMTCATRPRTAWRRAALDLIPTLALVGLYGLSKLIYFASVKRISVGYAVGVDIGVWLQHLGQYASACFNVTTLLHPGRSSAMLLGAALVIAFCVALYRSRRQTGAWPLLAGGVAFFVVSLAPVFPLLTHYKDHYVGLAAFGMAMIVVAVCQLVTQHWQALAGAIAAAVLLLDLATGGRAWRSNDIFRLVVGGSANAAAWVQTLQDIARRGEPIPAIFLPAEPTTNTVFGMGKVQEYFPSLPPQVVLFKPGRRPKAAETGLVIDKPTPLAPGQPLPGWEPRWDVLRSLAGPP